MVKCLQIYLKLMRPRVPASTCTQHTDMHTEDPIPYWYCQHFLRYDLSVLCCLSWTHYVDQTGSNSQRSTCLCCNQRHEPPLQLCWHFLAQGLRTNQMYIKNHDRSKQSDENYILSRHTIQIFYSRNVYYKDHTSKEHIYMLQVWRDSVTPESGGLWNRLLDNIDQPTWDILP